MTTADRPGGAFWRHDCPTAGAWQLLDEAQACPHCGVKLPPMTVGKATFRERAAHSITLTELLHSRIEGRLMAALLAGSLLFDLTDPVMLLLGTPSSLMYRAALATTMGPQVLALTLVGLAVLLLPFLAAQVFGWSKYRRDCTRMACLSLALSAVVWFFLAWRCIPLDMGSTPLLFVRYGGGSILFALALAWSLNAEQIRTTLERRP